MSVRIVPVGHRNWRAVADLDVAEEQRRFVGPTTRYLSLTHLGEQGWSPLAILAHGEIVGFAMWAHEPTDDAFWIGGFLVDCAHQRRGHGPLRHEGATRDGARIGGTVREAEL